MTSTADTLADALERFQLVVPQERVPMLDRYCRLLWEWNNKLNLTRHTTFEKFVSRDVCDSQQLAALLEPGEHVLDVGSGGGVPGMVLAILRPDLEVSLSECIGKKARALDAMIGELGLEVPVYPCRAEEVLLDMRFDAVVARAVGPLAKMLKWFEPHWDSMGRLLVVKGPKWVEERGEARHLGLMKKLNLRRAARYPLFGTDSKSVILKIWPVPPGEELESADHDDD